MNYTDNPILPTAPRTVLVIDDDPMLLDLLACTIDCADYQTTTTTDGTEGLRLARIISPALVLCDLTMPGLGGLEVLRMLRADPITAEVPLVLMTGAVSPDLGGMAADGFLAKPFDLDTVQQLVRTLIQPQEVSVVE
jgi:CheY-like chemotaxis protein